MIRSFLIIREPSIKMQRLNLHSRNHALANHKMIQRLTLTLPDIRIPLFRCDEFIKEFSKHAIVGEWSTNGINKLEFIQITLNHNASFGIDGENLVNKSTSHKTLCKTSLNATVDGVLTNTLPRVTSARLGFVVHVDHKDTFSLEFESGGERTTSGSPSFVVGVNTTRVVLECRFSVDVGKDLLRGGGTASTVDDTNVTTGLTTLGVDNRVDLNVRVDGTACSGDGIDQVSDGLGGVRVTGGGAIVILNLLKTNDVGTPEDFLISPPILVLDVVVTNGKVAVVTDESGRRDWDGTVGGLDHGTSRGTTTLSRKNGQSSSNRIKKKTNHGNSPITKRKVDNTNNVLKSISHKTLGLVPAGPAATSIRSGFESTTPLLRAKVIPPREFIPVAFLPKLPTT
ncbi:hypothetical protein BC829DRAFT_401689 [Chytridium lagenaria]|nr:hypothetical protein BC829DRAFT_401689 [Chytridium lagenaria]